MYMHMSSSVLRSTDMYLKGKSKEHKPRKSTRSNT